MESRKRRCPSAKSRSKASVLLPEPLTPVITTNLSRGMETERFLRLCSRAPMMSMASSGAGRCLAQLLTINLYHERGGFPKQTSNERKLFQIGEEFDEIAKVVLGKDLAQFLGHAGRGGLA